MALSQCIKRRHLAQRFFEFYAGLKKIFREGRDRRALLVQPSRIPRWIWKTWLYLEEKNYICQNLLFCLSFETLEPIKWNVSFNIFWRKIIFVWNYFFACRLIPRFLGMMLQILEKCKKIDCNCASCLQLHAFLQTDEQLIAHRVHIPTREINLAHSRCNCVTCYKGRAPNSSLVGRPISATYEWYC